jgi:hypothetical protein
MLNYRGSLCGARTVHFFFQFRTQLATLFQLTKIDTQQNNWIHSTSNRIYYNTWCVIMYSMRISNISICVRTEMCTNNKFVSTLIWKRRTVRGTTETCRHQVNERSAWLHQRSMKVNWKPHVFHLHNKKEKKSVRCKSESVFPGPWFFPPCVLHCKYCSHHCRDDHWVACKYFLHPLLSCKTRRIGPDVRLGRYYRKPDRNILLTSFIEGAPYIKEDSNCQRNNRNLQTSSKWEVCSTTTAFNYSQLTSPRFPSSQ